MLINNNDNKSFYKKIDYIYTYNSISFLNKKINVVYVEWFYNRYNITFLKKYIKMFTTVAHFVVDFNLYNYITLKKVVFKQLLINIKVSCIISKVKELNYNLLQIANTFDLQIYTDYNWKSKNIKLQAQSNVQSNVVKYSIIKELMSTVNTNKKINLDQDILQKLNWIESLIFFKNFYARSRLLDLKEIKYLDFFTDTTINTKKTTLDDKVFINALKDRIISHFIKKGLKSKALLIWYETLRLLRIKISLVNQVNKSKISVNTVFNISTIIRLSINNVRPVATLFYKSSKKKSSDGTLPRVKLSKDTTAELHKRSLGGCTDKQFLKDILSVHDKLALNWILESLELKKKSHKSISIPFKLANEFWNIAFMKGNKSIEKKKSLYKLFFKSY